ncbi:hypothetical protein SAMN05216360_10731 [Methylobacterium phyllostachyos]|uniref:Uncharacterized protein n=1 Tax=Methylobacterium phyllostachyos TaxID=582672 RepID=A0A1H0A231_9HYPH|nr:hypothetical protein [Methylobacterium phyllostachyos]SDN27251.1 hypothetical protein SAMN05216360_10731 [Methylobacterium phyllostachyos]
MLRLVHRFAVDETAEASALGRGVRLSSLTMTGTVSAGLGTVAESNSVDGIRSQVSFTRACHLKTRGCPPRIPTMGSSYR